jgi:hypothetical protein
MGLARRIAPRVVPGKGSKWGKCEQKTLINGVSRLCQIGLSMILTSWVAERHTDAGITCAKNNGKGIGGQAGERLIKRHGFNSWKALLNLGIGIPGLKSRAF